MLTELSQPMSGSGRTDGCQPTDRRLNAAFLRRSADAAVNWCVRQRVHPNLVRANVNPNKTWEGALTGLAVSVALPWALWFTFPHFLWWDLLITGLIVGIGGQAGDLVISVFKRDMRIKNMATLIRGHGGVLDRIDSLIYVAPLFVHYIPFSPWTGNVTLLTGTQYKEC